MKSEMADSYFTLSSSVVVKTDNKVKPIVSNRLYRFNNKKTWNDVFDEVTDPEEVDLKKTDHHKPTHPQALVSGKKIYLDTIYTTRYVTVHL